MPILRVALNVPLDTLFDYTVDTADRSEIGLRVCVPFGPKKLTGVVLDVCSESQIPAEKLKPVIAIFRDVPPLSDDLLALFAFCHSYYHHPLGMIVMNSLPVRLRGTQPVKATLLGHDAAQIGYEWNAGGSTLDASTIPAHHTVVHKLVQALNNAGWLGLQAARAISPRAIKILKQWMDKGWIVEKRRNPASGATAVTDVAAEPVLPELTAEQGFAVDSVTAQFDRFDTWLLHGVTGSGKTEVYLRLIDRALSMQKQTLVLIPEINLTPQLERVFRARFAQIEIVSLHSGLNDTERLQGWLLAQQGRARVVLGTRLAVFTPMPELGLIIVDEEHDASFKQQDGLRYSARDLAVFRAKQWHIPVVLGSATPAFESYQWALTGRYRHVRLTRRAVKSADMPRIDCIDMRAEKPKLGLSAQLIRAINKCVAQQQQCLVFINRRGYAPILLCQSCGWNAVCRRCSSRLVVHMQDRKLSCHHCGHVETFPYACPQCGNQDIKPFGRGTQRIEETFAELFPTARILRIDRDTTARKNAWRDILRAIHRHEVDVLIGTQLLAKGHDFPNLALVGILDSDVSLFSTDFRAGERLFAQLMQVSGRAGRATVAGRVLIQTEYPQHPLYQALQRHDYDALAQTILAERRAAGFPPYVYQALLRAEAHSQKKVIDFLSAAHRLAHATTDSVQHAAVEIFDPVPAAMTRLKGMERAHLLVQSPSRKSLQFFLTAWYRQLNTLASYNIRWALDVDPIEF